MNQNFEDVKEIENTLTLLKTELNKIISIIEASNGKVNETYLNDLKRILNEAQNIYRQMGATAYPYYNMVSQCLEIIYKAKFYIKTIEKNDDLTF